MSLNLTKVIFKPKPNQTLTIALLYYKMLGNIGKVEHEECDANPFVMGNYCLTVLIPTVVTKTHISVLTTVHY